MATKAEIQAHIAKKLHADVERKLTGAYVRNSVSEQISINDWNAIAAWLQARDFASIGKHIGSMVRNTMVRDANSDAAAILADNSMNMTEYAKIEGLS